jgi:hypothetical protein
MATAEQAQENWGERDEAGFVRGLKKKGMTIASSFAELLDNSSDAHATHCRFTIANKLIYFSDNGNGMNRNNFKNMFIMERENNGGTMSKGGLGVGVKNALALLSNWQYSCVILTKTSEGNHLKVEIPWGRIFEQLRWVKMITPAIEMTHEEILEFNNFVPSENKEHGTVIKIKKTFKICDQIKNQFNDDTKKNLSKTERWDIQIQSPSINISLCDFAENPNDNQILHQYKFICNDEPVYRDHTTDIPIELWRHHEGEIFYVFPEDESLIFFDKHGNGVSKTPSQWLNGGANRYENTGHILIYQAQTPVNHNWFDPANPLQSGRYLSRTNNFMLSLDRNKKFFNHNEDDEEIDFYKTPLIRNGRLIGHFEIPGYKIKGRGYGNTQEQNKKNLWTKCTRDIIKYDTQSYQDNEFDDIMGIQQKKSSWDPGCII